MPLRPASDDGDNTPASQYTSDYEKLSLQELRDFLSTPPSAITNVQNDWHTFAQNLNSDVIAPLQQAMTYLDSWDSKASGPGGGASAAFKDRANQILQFGQQMASAAYQASEDFNDLSRTFHTSAWFLGLSIGDMNTLHNLAENALNEWSADLFYLVRHLYMEFQEMSAGGYYNSQASLDGTAFNGYATWQTVAVKGSSWPLVNFQYLYGHGATGSYPGVAEFSGQVQVQGSQLAITMTAAQAGPYPQKTVDVNFSDMGVDWAGATFPDTHRSQLVTLLSQAGGSSYAPLVRKFPQLAPAPWLKDSGNGSTNPNPNSTYPSGSYPGGSAGTLPGGGSAGLPGLGGTSGTAGPPTGTGTGLPGLPGAGSGNGSGTIGSPSGSGGNPFGGVGPGQAAARPSWRATPRHRPDPAASGR